MHVVKKRYSEKVRKQSMNKHDVKKIKAVTQMVVAEIKSELREYKDKYPDATIDDAIGVVAGWNAAIQMFELEEE